MSIFAKSDSTSKLESELARLEKKRTALSVRLIAAQSAEAAAIEARRRHLVESDDEDFRGAEKFTATIETAQRDRIAIEGAIATVDALIAEGRQAIVAAKECAARQKRAAEIAKRIERIEPLSAQAEKQFEALLATLERIATEGDDPALDVKEYRELQGHVDRLPVTAIIGASLAQALFRDAADFMTVEKTGAQMFARVFLPMMIERYDGLSRDIPIDHGDKNSFTPKPLSGALQSNLIEPLRAAAKEILDGSRPITSNKPMIKNHDDAEPVFDWRWLVFVKPARWQDWKGETVTQSDSRAMVPQPVAEAALKAGVAFPENAPEAQAHEERRYQMGFHNDAVAMSKQTVTLDVRWPATTRAAA